MPIFAPRSNRLASLAAVITAAALAPACVPDVSDLPPGDMVQDARRRDAGAHTDASDAPRDGTFEATQIAVDAFDPAIVYVAGRSGAWKSEDGGGHWRPAVHGLGGTMHNHVVALASGGAATDDVDWVAETTSDHFYSATDSTAALHDPDVTLDLARGGHRYQVTDTTPRDFLVDGRSIADAFFRATCVRPADIDVSADGRYVYVAQFGGGVLVARAAGASWP